MSDWSVRQIGDKWIGTEPGSGNQWEMTQDVNGVWSIPWNKYSAPVSSQINIPKINTSPMQSLSPIQSTAIDPLLSTQNLLKPLAGIQDTLNRPTMDVARSFVEPAIPLLTKTLEAKTAQDRSNAQSDFLRRGITGSSTEVQTITKDIPAQANEALVNGINQLMLQAIPLAQNEKQQMIDTAIKTTSLSTQIRQMIGDEQFKLLDLNQKREMANQDVQLKLTLADVEMKFQAAMKQAEMAFTAAENDKDRAIAEREYQYLLSERKKAREGAFMSSLTKLAGLGIGLAVAPTGASAGMLAAYGGLGMAGGGAAGDAFGGLFTMD